MKILLRVLLVCQLFCVAATAQVQVTLVLDTTNTSGQVYLAGNMNGWNPGDTSFRFNADRQLKLTAAKGDIVEFKLTRGSWGKVELGINGEDIANRVFKVGGDTVIVLKVADWKNAINNVQPRKKHTASPNVIILDTAFYIPQLDRKRTIRLYLPPDYKTSGKKYPVLYMQDGQNCFDEFTSGFGEWKIDETLDHFYDSCKKSMIVVAIDHGDSKRIQEYNPYDNERFGKGEGMAYAAFVANTLKPFIDSSFRTLSSKKYTNIAGSSMGGVISMYAILDYPNVFGGAGIFSPAFGVSQPLFVEAKKKNKALKGAEIFFYAGGKESKTIVQDMMEMQKILQSNQGIGSELHIDDDAQHNEGAWAKWFPVYLNWIMRE